ncbi:phosphate/phosphite/phosphonate ABC transporter substrate-binding protein [Streptomyces sp. NPDC007861]|uniref:phosphate/phosphite/phosphonate ABC transporter substrate-binding protein n=1 Tax=Streptomyces sp. NPDC007861 TaxID=3154893 RepID=UPI0033DEF6DB
MNSRTALRRGLGATLCAASALSLTACGGSGKDSASLSDGVVKIGLPPGEADPKFQEQFQPVTDLIAKGAGAKAEVTKTSDYLGVVEAMRSGLIDAAGFSPFPTPLAQAVAGVEPLVVAKGVPYSSVFVCRTDSGVKGIDDLRGKKIAFVDPGSTSGNYIPKLMLKRAGIDPEKDVKGTYAGGHDTAELAVKQGSVDCAADAKVAYEQMAQAKMISADEQKIVVESDPIPISMVIIVRKGIDEKTKQGITDAFLGKGNAAALKALGATSFKKAEDSDFTLFRDAAEELGVDLKELSQK